MNAIRVRAAAEPDLAALCRLYVEFHEFHAQGVPDRLRSTHAAPFDPAKLKEDVLKILGDGEAALLIAAVGGEPVGLAEVYLRRDAAEALRVAHQYGYLQSLMVTENSRRAGIGKRLTDAAEQWARARGAAEMRLDTWEFAAGPQEFYERQGYRTLRRTLVKEL